MENQVDPKEAVRDLAIHGHPSATIQKMIEERGCGGHLDQPAIETLVTEARAARNLVPAQPSHIVSRVIGAIAILMGIGGLAIGTIGEFHPSRYSPDGVGFWAVILGALLVIKPGWSNESLK